MDNSMKIKIKLFGWGRELSGKSDLTWEIPESVKLQTLIAQLEDEYPKLKELDRFLVAVNMEYAEMNMILKEGDEVAIIPPVSGG